MILKYNFENLKYLFGYMELIIIVKHLCFLMKNLLR